VGLLLCSVLDTKSEVGLSDAVPLLYRPVPGNLTVNKESILNEQI
jgi:hypothetical protein